MDRFVLDSNTLTHILKRSTAVIHRLREAATANAELYLCPVAYYEVRRGLLARAAARQLTELNALAGTLLWVDFERPMWDDAADMWAMCRRTGRRQDDDADLLIAAYARGLAATVVTNNTADFVNLGVPLADWLEPAGPAAPRPDS